MLQIKEVKIFRGDTKLRYQMEARKGEIVVIKGFSGVGKTTLLETIAGFVKIESGRITWDDQDITPLPPWQRPVSMLFQADNLFEHLSVMENLLLAGNSLASDVLLAAAQRLDVKQQLHKLPTQLSGGQRQRIALIRTMLRSEPLILLDEPFSELDPDMRGLAALWTSQTAHKLSKTVLIVTHQQEDVSNFANRVITLS